MKEKIIVAIGTKNAAKIKAVEIAFRTLLPSSSLKFESYGVETGVSNQPIGLDETINGSINRAKNAFNQLTENDDSGIDYIGVGIEAGLVPISQTKSGYLDFQFAAIYYNNKITIGSGSAFEYPNSVIEKINNHQASEIGEVFENISGIKSLNQKGGAISLLTKNLVTRTDILKNSVIMALLPIINQKFYNNNL